MCVVDEVTIESQNYRRLKLNIGNNFIWRGGVARLTSKFSSHVTGSKSACGLYGFFN